MRLNHAAVVLSAALALGIGARATAVTIDMASTFPKDMIFLGDGPKYFAKTIEEITQGDVKIKIHGAGDLVPALEVLNAVSSGAVAASYDWEGYWGGVVPVANLVGALPFGPQPDVLAGWIWEGGGRQIVQKAYDKLNVVSLPCVIVPAEPAGWFNKEIKSVDDINGLRMRIGGLAARAMAKVGVSTQIIPGGEVFVSLERGRIDAAEFSLPSIDQSIQLQKAGKYYYFPGWHQPSSINSIKFNKGVWEKFTDLQRQQIEAACRSSFLWTLTKRHTRPDPRAEGNGGGRDQGQQAARQRAGRPAQGHGRGDRRRTQKGRDIRRGICLSERLHGERGPLEIPAKLQVSLP